MPFEVTVDSDLEGSWKGTLNEITLEMARDVQTACEEAIVEEQSEHPYQDHTYHLTDTANGKIESADYKGATGVLEWPMDYASYVDQGTSRAQAFPFVERTQQHAERILLFRTESSIDKALERLTR